MGDLGRGSGMTLIQESRISRNHKCSLFNSLVSDVQISASRQRIDRRTPRRPMMSTDIARESPRDSAFDASPKQLNLSAPIKMLNTSLFK